ncbi:MAG: hypothetical protein U0232_18605 [Thermomicrobiales bacterium]
MMSRPWPVVRVPRVPVMVIWGSIWRWQAWVKEIRAAMSPRK